MVEDLSSRLAIQDADFYGKSRLRALKRVASYGGEILKVDGTSSKGSAIESL